MSVLKANQFPQLHLGLMLNRLAPVEKNSKMDIEAMLRDEDHHKKRKMMRANTLSANSRQSDDSPGTHWADLPDPIEKKNVKLTKKQRVYEGEIIAGLLKHWEEIFRVAVQKKGRKIMLTKDEYSIDYNVKNRRELILPPEYYLNLTELEKYYMDTYAGKHADWDITSIRMYLERRYDIKSDLIHLSNVSKFCKVPMVDLVRKRYKPLQNKLLQKVKKRIKLRNAKRIVLVQKNAKRQSIENELKMKNTGKIRTHNVKRVIAEVDEPDDIKSPKSNEDEEKYSDISSHEKAERISILDLIVHAHKKVTDLDQAFEKFSKKNKQGKGFMNIYSFSSFLGVLLQLRLTSANKRALFNLIDYNQDGYVNAKDFRRVFSCTEDDIQNAIKDPINFQDGDILDMVIEQIYYDIVFFNRLGIAQIQKKLDAKGRISLEKLEQQLSFYKVVWTKREKELMSNTVEEDIDTGKRLIPFRKLIEKTISKSNLHIDFKLTLQKQGTIVSDKQSKEKRFKKMEDYYEDEQRRKAEEEERRRREAEEVESDGYSQFEDSTASPVKNKSRIFKGDNKELTAIRDKFGKKFLDIFQRTLMATISKNDGSDPYLQYHKYNPVFSSSKPLAQSKGEIPQFLVYNYQNSNNLFSSHVKNKYKRLETQGLQSGIQGKSIQRQQRISTTTDINKQIEQSTEKPVKPKMSNDQILFAIERLSSKFGTPFTIKGHKEEFINQVSQNTELRNKLLDYNHKNNRFHFSVPASGENSRPSLATLNPLHNLSAKKCTNLLYSPGFLPNPDGTPNKKYLLSYMNAKPAEKEKIVNLFSKLFREFHFNKKEDKDLILRHIR